MNRKISFLLIALFNLVSIICAQGVWKEYDKNPVFKPIRGQQTEHPCVLFDKDKFRAAKPESSYKMWFATKDGIALAYSDTGITWNEYNKSKPFNGLLAKASRPKVVYDAYGFGGNQFFYKIWYWSGENNSISSMRYAVSADGINWFDEQPIRQHKSDPNLQLITGTNLFDNYFYYIYGPATILYISKNSNPGWDTLEDKSDDHPFEYKYIMFFNSSSNGLSPEGSILQTSLAYSGDGLYWIRYGDVPVIIPSGSIAEWNGLAIFDVQVIPIKHSYCIFYSGSNDRNLLYSFTETSIGYGASDSGIKWVLQAFPIFNPEINQNWETRGLNSATGYLEYSYIYYKIHKPFICNKFKIWYTGWNDLKLSSIGYAYTLMIPSGSIEGTMHSTKDGFSPLSVDLSIDCHYCMEDIEGGCDCHNFEYLWDFGDGFAESSLHCYSVHHMFVSEGIYNIVAIVKDCITDLYWFNNVINVINPLAACFSTQPESGFVPLTVSFDAGCSKGLNNVPIISYSWDFDDDQSGSGKNVSHIFTAPGDYYVVLEITNKDGIKQTSHKKITVFGVLPPASISLHHMEDRSLFRNNWFNIITWASNAGNSGLTITKYNIYRKLSSQPDLEYSIIGSVDGNTFEFIDTNINQDEKYSYVLTAVETGGHESAYSIPVSN